MKFLAGIGCKFEYDIRFQYDHEGDAVVTTCIISFVDPAIPRGRDKYHEVSRGIATQSPNDVHEKNEGRRHSLARAVKNFHKSSRRAAWVAYLTRKGKKAR